MPVHELVGLGVGLIVVTLLVVGAVSGRIKPKPCCPDARHDLRMRDAFTDDGA